ncbi:hypothetical protein QAD02_016345 [Eretmocerus hayati]|uniref:Uncharacterized protein n=1 Tax=Eretmocerus hayati TaxID=131215 RepID=A0ACC2PAU4_9HYME|nr:hypothetical protein QAD02_016345 [Eretmocerus hayati]
MPHFLHESSNFIHRNPEQIGLWASHERNLQTASQARKFAPPDQLPLDPTSDPPVCDFFARNSSWPAELASREWLLFRGFRHPLALHSSSRQLTSDHAATDSLSLLRG